MAQILQQAMKYTLDSSVMMAATAGILTAHNPLIRNMAWGVVVNKMHTLVVSLLDLTTPEDDSTTVMHRVFSWNSPCMKLPYDFGNAVIFSLPIIAQKCGVIQKTARLNTIFLIAHIISRAVYSHLFVYISPSSPRAPRERGITNPAVPADGSTDAGRASAPPTTSGASDSALRRGGGSKWGSRSIGEQDPTEATSRSVDALLPRVQRNCLVLSGLISLIQIMITPLFRQAPSSTPMTLPVQMFSNPLGR